MTNMDRLEIKNDGDKGEKTVEKVISRRRERIAAAGNAVRLLIKIVVIIAVIYFLLTYMYGVGVVSGEGMYPRLRDGDLVIYYRLASEWNIGDVIVFKADGEQRYGRIVAMGGDTVDLSEDGQLVVNGSVQQEEIFFATLKDGRNTQLPITLQKEEVFVLGDNRTNAVDSRDFGPVNIRDIKGKAISLLRRRGL